MPRLPSITQSLDGAAVDLALRRLATSLTTGADASTFYGAGIEFAHSRQYLAGDAVSAVDWKATARRRSLFLKQFEVPKAAPTFIVVDRSASMSYGSLPRTKYFWAVQLAAVLGMASLARGGPVATVSTGNPPILRQPSRSRGALVQTIEELRTYSLQDRSSVADALSALEQIVRETSLLIVLSDLQDPDCVLVLKRLALRHECVALRLRDPAETHQHRFGYLRAKEAEQSLAWLATPWRDAGPLARSAEEQLTNAGIDCDTIDIDRPVVPQVWQVFENRAVRKSAQ